MERYKRQKGQGIIEFAIVLPLFIFMILGFSYGAMLCHDYITMTSIVRDSTRTLAISVDPSTTKAALQVQYANPGLLVYTVNMGSATDFALDDSDANNVTVTMRAHDPWWGGFSLGGMNFSLPDPIQVSLTMRKEG